MNKIGVSRKFLFILLYVKSYYISIIEMFSLFKPPRITCKPFTYTLTAQVVNDACRLIPSLQLPSRILIF